MFKKICTGIFILLLTTPFSCRKPIQGSEFGKIETGENLGQVGEIGSEEIDEGMIIFSSGNVRVSGKSEEKAALIGDRVSIDDSIITEYGAYCEIQFGDAAVIRVEENTVISLNSVFTGPDGTRIDLGLESGTIICKVEKLLSKEDSFKIKTDTAVCGVRGTEFSVTKKENTETVLAVKEGAVAVVPPEVDNIRRKAQSNSETAVIIGTLDDTAVMVGASEQITLRKETFSETRRTLDEISSLVDDITVKSDPDKTKLEELKALTVTSKSEITAANQTAADSKVSLTDDNKKQLEKTDQMNLVGLTAVPESVNSLYKMTFRTEPGDAEIYINGTFLGKGQVSKIYPKGEVLNIRITQSSYEEFSFSLTVDKETSRIHTVKLLKNKKGLKSESIDKTETALTEKPGTKNIDTADASGNEKISDDDMPVTVVITANPQDAEILINDSPAGNSPVTMEFKRGAEIKLSLTRNGFAAMEKTIVITPEETSYEIKLEPRPVENKISVMKGKAIGSLISSGEMVFFSDADGTVYGVNIESGKKWSKPTGNKPNENSFPVIFGSNLYLTGVKEMVILDINNGSSQATVPLSGDMVHLFGRRVLPYKNNILFPANNGIVVMDKSKGSMEKLIPIPSGSRMTPNIWKGKIVIADQKGALLVINPDTGEIEKEIPTQAIQPIAVQVGVYGDYAVYNGRKGLISAINIAGGSVLWEKNLNGTIISDIAVGNKGCYVFYDGKIYGLSWTNGENLFNPISGVSSPPLSDNGYIIFGSTDGRVIIADGSSGKTIRYIDLGSPVEIRPVKIEDKIIVLAGNEIIVLNPEGMIR